MAFATSTRAPWSVLGSHLPISALLADRLLDVGAQLLRCDRTLKQGNPQVLRSLQETTEPLPVVGGTLNVDLIGPKAPFLTPRILGKMGQRDDSDLATITRDEGLNAPVGDVAIVLFRQFPERGSAHVLVRARHLRRARSLDWRRRSTGHETEVARSLQIRGPEYPPLWRLAVNLQIRETAASNNHSGLPRAVRDVASVLLVLANAHDAAVGQQPTSRTPHHSLSLQPLLTSAVSRFSILRITKSSTLCVGVARAGLVLLATIRPFFESASASSIHSLQPSWYL